MLVIDENISEIEVWRLRECGLAVRQIGPDVANQSIGDDDILPVLHRLKQPTFFTRDGDFWKPRLWHAGYCLVFMDVPELEGERWRRRSGGPSSILLSTRTPSARERWYGSMPTGCIIGNVAAHRSELHLGWDHSPGTLSMNFPLHGISWPSGALPQACGNSA